MRERGRGEEGGCGKDRRFGNLAATFVVVLCVVAYLGGGWGMRVLSRFVVDIDRPGLLKRPPVFQRPTMFDDTAFTRAHAALRGCRSLHFVDQD